MDEKVVKEFANKIFQDMSSSFSTAMAFIGVKNGIFKIMQDRGELNIDEITKLTGLDQRYLEEWLKGMVSTQYIIFNPDNSTYILPEEHAFLLASEGSDHFMGGLFYSIPMMVSVASKVAESFKNGGGVKFNEYGEDGVDAISIMNEGTYKKRLGSYWIKSMPDIFEKLTSGCDILDFGCGTGNVSITLSKEFPKTQPYGLDLDEISIKKAKSNAEKEGLSKKIKFINGGLEKLSGNKFYLITLLDCIHDLVDPVGILKKLKTLLTDDGSLFIVEPKVEDNLEKNINPIAGMYYGMSLFHCMTQSLASGGPGLGTCMGPSKMKELVSDSGFKSVEILKIKSPVSLFYRVKK